MPSAEVVGDVRRNRALKLLAVGTIVDPFAGGRDPLASGLGHGQPRLRRHDAPVPWRAESIGGWGLLTPRQRCGVTLPSIPTLCPKRNPRHGRRVPIGRLCSGCARFLDLVRRFWPYGMRCN